MVGVQLAILLLRPIRIPNVNGSDDVIGNVGIVQVTVFPVYRWKRRKKDRERERNRRKEKVKERNRRKEKERGSKREKERKKERERKK